MHAGLLANILGPDGLIVIAVVAIVLLFGGSKIPKLARGLGTASHEFRKGLEQGDTETTSTTASIPRPVDTAKDPSNS